jgi:hypothetical protein
VAAGGEEPDSIRGRVVDPAGVGIAGARVSAIDARAWRNIILGVEERYANALIGVPGLRREYAELASRSPAVTAAADGTFAFRGLGEAEYSLVASHPAFLPGGEAQVIVSPGSTVHRDLELAPGNAIEGTVIDEEGRPVPGAVVSSEPSLVASARGMGKVLQLLDRFVDGSALVPVNETKSGRDGRFRMAGLEPVPQDVLARKPGFAPGRTRRVPPGTRGVTLVLPRGMSVAGAPPRRLRASPSKGRRWR